MIPPAYILVYTKYRFLVSVHINEIDLNAETDNIPLKSGYFKFIQTRLHIDVNWKIIII